MVTALIVGSICIVWLLTAGYAWCLCRCKAQADAWEYREEVDDADEG